MPSVPASASPAFPQPPPGSARTPGAAPQDRQARPAPRSGS